MISPIMRFYRNRVNLFSKCGKNEMGVFYAE